MLALSSVWLSKRTGHQNFSDPWQQCYVSASVCLGPWRLDSSERLRAHREDAAGSAVQGGSSVQAHSAPALPGPGQLQQSLRLCARHPSMSGSAGWGATAHPCWLWVYRRCYAWNKWVFLRVWGLQHRGILMILLGACMAELELNTLPERANSIHARSAEHWLYTEPTSIHRVYEQILHYRKAVKLLVAFHYLYQQHSSISVALHPN